MAGLLLALGALGVVIGIGAGTPIGTRAAALAYAAGSLLEGWQMAQLYRREPS